MVAQEAPPSVHPTELFLPEKPKQVSSGQEPLNFVSKGKLGAQNNEQTNIRNFLVFHRGIMNIESSFVLLVVLTGSVGQFKLS